MRILHVYRYSLWKLVIAILLCAGFAYGGYYMTHAHSGRIVFFGYLLMLLFVIPTLIFVRFLLSNREILRIDPHGIEYKTMFWKQRVAWREFRGTALETVRTQSTLGMESTARHLKLDFGKGYFGNCSISEKLLAGGVEVEDILVTLHECHDAADALDRGDYRHASLGPSSAGMRQIQPAAAPQPVASGFGRKGL